MTVFSSFIFFFCFPHLLYFSSLLLISFLLLLWWYWGLNSGRCPCKAGTLPLETHLQSLLLWLFWRWGVSQTICQAGLNPWSSPSQAMITVVGHQCLAYSFLFLRQGLAVLLRQAWALEFKPYLLPQPPDASPCWALVISWPRPFFDMQGQFCPAFLISIGSS
jgi:hypothetical protein